MTIAILVATFVILLLVGMPIAFGIGIASALAGLTYVLMGNPFVMDNVTLVQRMLFGINSFPLLACIFFVFTGVVMVRGGVAVRMVRMAEVLVGRFPGGLAQMNVMSSMLFGGVSGSAVADVSSIGRMMINAMEKDGYTRRFATAITLASATMGPIIPPSIPFILYAYIAGNVSVAGLLLAGFIPGVMIGGGLLLASYIHGKLYHPSKTPKLSLREKVIRIFDGIGALFALVIILVGITSGYFTATEAGAVAAVYALFLTMVVYRSVTWRDLPGVMWEACLTNAVVMMLIATTSVFTYLVTYENIPDWVAENVLAITEEKWVLLLMINVLLLAVGLFIDLAPALIMLVPILLPLADKLEIDLIHLGVVMVVNLTFGLITPPVGTSLFVGCRIANIQMTELVKPLLPLLAIMLSVLFFVTFMPELFMWLPRSFGFAK